MQLFDSPSKTSRQDNPEHSMSQQIQPTDQLTTDDLGNKIAHNNLDSSLEPLQATDGDRHDNSPKPLNSESGFGPVLRNPNFLALWSGQVFSQLADKVYLVLMIAIISSAFQQPGQTISTWVSAIMIAFTIPAVLFGYLAGAFVDRWQKKTVLVVTNLLRGMLVLVLPILLWISQGLHFGTVPLGFCLMLGITFLVSTLTQFFAPAEQATIPLILKRHQLLAGNSLYTTTMMASVIIGFAVGQPLLDFADHLFSNFGNGLTFGKELFVGSSYCFAGLLLTKMKVRETPNGSKARESFHVFEEIRDGVAYLGKNRPVRSAILQLTILFCVFAALAVLAVRLAEVIPAIESDQFGFLLAAGGMGMGIGASILGHFGARFTHRQLSLFGSFIMTLALGGLALFSTQLWPVFLLITLLGFGAAIVGVPMQTTIQAETPEDMRGKVFGLQNNVVNIALSLPLAVAGVAEALVGLQVVFLTLGAIVMAGGVFTWYISGNKPAN